MQLKFSSGTGEGKERLYFTGKVKIDFIDERQFLKIWKKKAFIEMVCEISISWRNGEI